MSRPGAVYRHYSAAGELLYIGSTYDPAKRIGGHRCDPRSWWVLQVETVKIEWFDTISEARRAEAAAIAAETPPHNVRDNEPSKSKRKPQIAGPVLAQWLSDNGVSIEDFARRTDSTPARIQSIIDGELCPNFKTTGRIERATNGDIPSCIWARGGNIYPWRTDESAEKARALLAPLIAAQVPA